MGGIDCQATFDPEYHPGLKATPAQNVAGMLMTVLERTAKQIKGDIDEHEQSNIRGAD